MSFQQRRSYDEEEYEGADPQPYAPDDEEWDDAAESGDESAPAALAEEEGEPEAAPPARSARPAPPPRRPAAPPRAPAPTRAQPPSRDPRYDRRPAARGNPPPRSGRNAVAMGQRGVRVSPNRRGATYEAGRPAWVMPAALAAAAVLLMIGAFIFLGNAGQRPTLGSDAGMATVSARGTELAGIAKNVDGWTTNGPEGVAATVNNKPIAMVDFLDRLQSAKEDYADQFQLNFGGDTGRRMADVLGFDVLDQMINFEVLMQEAKKQNIIPNPTQVEQRYTDTRTQVAQQHLTWDTFLSQQHMSDQEFRQTIVDGFTYLVIANNNSQQGKNDDEKAKLLADYICSTRAKYDVKVYVHFIVPQQPCSSAQQMPGGPPANMTVTVPAGQPAPVETSGPPVVNPQFTPQK